MQMQDPKPYIPDRNGRSYIYHPDPKGSAGPYSCAQHPYYIPTQQIQACLKFKPEGPLYNMPRRENRHIRIVNNIRGSGRTACDSNVCDSCPGQTQQPSCSCSGSSRNSNTNSRSLRDPSDPCVPKLRPLLICKDCGCTYRERLGAASERNSNLVQYCGFADEEDNSVLFSINPMEAALIASQPPCKVECPCPNCRRFRREGDHFRNCACSLCESRKSKCLNIKYYAWRRRQNEYEDDCECNNDDCDDDEDSQDCDPCFDLSYGQNGNSSPSQSCYVINGVTNQRRNCRPCAPILQKRACCPPKKHGCECCYCQIAENHKRALHGPKCCCQNCMKYRCEQKQKQPCCSTLSRCSRPRAGIPKRKCRDPASLCMNMNCNWIPFDPESEQNCGLQHGPLCGCSQEYQDLASGTLRYCPDQNEPCLCHNFTPKNWVRKAPCERKLCPAKDSDSRPITGQRRCSKTEATVCDEIDQSFDRSDVVQVREEITEPFPPPPTKTKSKSLSNKTSKINSKENTAPEVSKASTKAGEAAAKSSPPPKAPNNEQVKSPPPPPPKEQEKAQRNSQGSTGTKGSNNSKAPAKVNAPKPDSPGKGQAKRKDSPTPSTSTTVTTTSDKQKSAPAQEQKKSITPSSNTADSKPQKEDGSQGGSTSSKKKAGVAGTGSRDKRSLEDEEESSTDYDSNEDIQDKVF